MNKKPYIAPAIELIDMESTAVIAASGESNSVDVSETEIPVGTNPRSPKRFWSSADEWDESGGVESYKRREEIVQKETKSPL